MSWSQDFLYAKHLFSLLSYSLLHSCDCLAQLPILLGHAHGSKGTKGFSLQQQTIQCLVNSVTCEILHLGAS